MATTLAAYISALEETWAGLVSACSGLSDEQWALPTELPGWSVKDNVSHVVGVELLMLGEPYPDHPCPDLPHVRGDASRWTEVPVDLRRPLPGAAVLSELTDVVERRLKALRALDEAALDTEVPGFFGRPMVLKHLLAIRVFDCWAHEQDVRRALGLPVDLVSSAAALSRRRLLLAFSGLPFTGRVIFATSDPSTVATVTFGSSYLDVDTPDADARIETSFDTLMRLGTGRVAYPGVDVSVSGDAALAEGVLRELAITP